MAAGSTYTPIATATGNGTSETITFSSIPNTYTDLVLVCNGWNTAAGGNAALSFDYFNGATASCSFTYLVGDGTNASSGRATNTDYIASFSTNSIDASYPATVVAHFQNYANTTTYKTVIVRTAIVKASAGQATAVVGLIRNTAAINSIRITSQVVNSKWTSNATFTLYGITAA